MPFGTNDVVLDAPVFSGNDKVLSEDESNKGVATQTTHPFIEHVKDAAKDLWGLINAPLIEATPGRTTVFGQDFNEPEIQSEMQRVAKSGTTAEKIGTGVRQSLDEFFSSFTSPLSVGTLGVAGLIKGAPALGRVLSAGFALSMGKPLATDVATELGTEYGKPKDKRDPQKLAALWTSAATGVPMVAATGLHAALGDKAPLISNVNEIAEHAPLTAQALKNTLPNKDSSMVDLGTVEEQAKAVEQPQPALPDVGEQNQITAKTQEQIPIEGQPSAVANPPPENLIGQSARNKILEQASSADIHPFKTSEDFANAYLPDTLQVPEGWSIKETIPSKYGSVYWEIRDPSGDFHKVSVRDHSPSPIREQQFGASQLNAYVENVNDPQQLSSGITDLENQIASWDVEGHKQQLKNEAQSKASERLKTANERESIAGLEKQLLEKEDALRRGIRIGNGKPITTDNQRQIAMASIEETRRKLNEAKTPPPAVQPEVKQIEKDYAADVVNAEKRHYRASSDLESAVIKKRPESELRPLQDREADLYDKYSAAETEAENAGYENDAKLNAWVKTKPNSLEVPDWENLNDAARRKLKQAASSDPAMAAIDFTAEWKQLTPKQKQEIYARGWKTVPDRNNNVLIGVKADAKTDLLRRTVTSKAQQIAPEPKGDVKEAQEKADKEQATFDETPKWTSATDETKSSETLGTELYAGVPNPFAVARSVQKLADKAMPLRKATDQRKAIFHWSAELQRSFQEAEQAQKEIQKVVPDEIKREGITNWIQADGDHATLAARAAATTNKKLKAGYEAALNLKPEEIQVARDIKAAYDALGQRAVAAGVIKKDPATGLPQLIDNYVTQIWNLGKSPGGSGTRTLKERFKFSRARTFGSFFAGEQAGFVPKTKDIAKLLPVYVHEMNNVIAARQLVEQLSKGKATDERPLLARRGMAQTVTRPAGGQAVLVNPDAVRKGRSADESLNDRSDYKMLPNQPALHDWIWLGEDTGGTPIYEKADVVLHPELYKQLKNVLGQSAIREWYNSSSGNVATAIPKLLVKGLDMAQSETKRTMLGLLAPFHQVQESWHGVGHKVIPSPVVRGGVVDRLTRGVIPQNFTIPKVDLVNNANHMDAARHGLMLAPDRITENQFMEGFKTSGLVRHIPVIGPMADWYSHYLFHEYIPGLKYKTYDAILTRNKKIYADAIKAKSASLTDVKVLSAEQANAAFGHLNYADLNRNPTVLHLMQMGLLAPDFLEARARFAGQALMGASGAKIGREQVVAVATLAVAQATLAYSLAKMSGGTWDEKHPFQFRNGNRTYTLRSVPEDVDSLRSDWRRFWHARLSPLAGKGALQYMSGVDYRGVKVSTWDTTKELMGQPVPITARAVLAKAPVFDKFLKPNTSLTIPEQLWGAAGIKISRFSAAAEVYKMSDEWKKQSGNAKLVAQAERRDKETYAPSDYQPLREALMNEDYKAAREQYDKLKKDKAGGKTPAIDLINKAMKSDAPFVSKDVEHKFVKSLTPEEKQIYDQAKAERKEVTKRFQKMKLMPKEVFGTNDKPL